LDGCLFWEHLATLTTTLHNFVKNLKQKPKCSRFSLAAEGFVWKENNNQQQEDKNEASSKMVGT
jgi:hypothetical protein